MGKRETGALRDQKQAKTAISAWKFGLFGTLGIHLPWWLGFQLEMSEPMSKWWQTANRSNSHIKRYKNLTAVSEMAKKSLTGDEFDASLDILTQIWPNKIYRMVLGSM